MKFFLKLFGFLLVGFLLLFGVVWLFLNGQETLPFTLDNQELNRLLTEKEIQEGYYPVFFYKYPQTDYLIFKYIQHKVVTSNN